jgi:hypothetical protein
MWKDNLNISQILDPSGNNSEIWTFDEARFYNGVILKATTVTEFIQQCFLSGDYSPIFEHVYEPVLGTREVLVKQCHLPEALDLIKIIKVELCRIMNHAAIIRAFVEYDNLLNATTNTEPWHPYEIQKSISHLQNYPPLHDTTNRDRSKRPRTSKARSTTFNPLNIEKNAHPIQRPMTTFRVTHLNQLQQAQSPT